jgi:hypothetical protein
MDQDVDPMQNFFFSRWKFLPYRYGTVKQTGLAMTINNQSLFPLFLHCFAHLI